MWVAERHRISWWTALTCFPPIVKNSGKGMDFLLFFPLPAPSPILPPQECYPKRHKSGIAIPQPCTKNIAQKGQPFPSWDEAERFKPFLSLHDKQPFEYPHAPDAYSEAGPVSGPFQEQFLLKGPNYFCKIGGPASHWTSKIQARIFAETA